MVPDLSMLILDDQKSFCDSIVDFFSGPGSEVKTAHTLADGLSLAKKYKFDVVLLDQNLPDGEGHTICAPLVSLQDQIKIILITAYPRFDAAVLAIKAGAYDYLSKPIELSQLEMVIARATRTIALERIAEAHNYEENRSQRQAPEVDRQPGLAVLAPMIEAAASSRSTVLITGESGCGKNVVARHLHSVGSRTRAPMITVNCAALPATLIEAELFGVEKGAFTGATQTRHGVFELASGGTLFLDEIGTMPLVLQTKLLGVLEDHVVRRLGGDLTRLVDVRVIAATNTNLEEAVREGRFREDLFYRLNVIRIDLPPLRARLQDLPSLIDHFLNEFASGRDCSLFPGEMERLMAYPWPGNIRELRNLIERAVLLQPCTELAPSRFLVSPAVPPQAAPPAGSGTNTPLASSTPTEVLSLDEMERRHIQSAYLFFQRHQVRTAHALGISESTLRRKLKQYEISS